MDWSPAARTRLDAALAAAGRAAARDGGDADEVVADLRQRVTDELAAANLGAVTAADVDRVLLRLGIPLPAAEAPPTVESHPIRRVGSAFLKALMAIFGWILPAVAIAWELGTRMIGIDFNARGLFFDPLPTPFHTVLAMLVPVTNALLWFRPAVMRTGRPARIVRLLHAIAMGAATYFAFLFIPVYPLAAIGVLFVVVGYGFLAFLPLAPLLSLPAGWSLRRAARGDVAGTAFRPWIDFVAGMAAFLALLAPPAINGIGLSLAVSGDAGERARGIALLRSVGSRSQLLDLCYRGGMRSTEDFASNLFGPNVDSTRARELYFRIYGEPFHFAPDPGLRSGLRGERLRVESEFVESAFDPDQGGERVGENLRGLSMVSSRLDGHLQAGVAAAYCEWTMIFRNDGPNQREARAQILLPPGGVVSRLTLWVNGEEREAAFSSVSKVRAAYERVVQARRDPVLVTHAGPDRVLVQCFPVPPGGGEMKIRFGIASPLPVGGDGAVSARLPVLLERNFSLRSLSAHAVQWESETPLAVTGSAWTVQSGGLLARAELPADALAHPQPALRAPRGGAATVASPDQLDSTRRVVTAFAAAAPARPPSRVAVVIDGSLAMKPYRDTVAGALAPARPGCRLALFAAERERLREQAAAEWTTDAGAAAAALVRGIAFAGAQDNTDALAKAWDFASGATDGVVLWVHGHAYERLGDPESIRQRLERRKPGPRIVSLQLADGPNRLVEKLDRLAVFELATRDGDAAGDTAATVRSLFAPSPILVERHLAADGETTDATSSSPHPSRLRARAEALALLVTTRPADAAAAGALAARYALVTPASGAVVLESAQQFREAGLEPVDPSSVTVVPEPSALTLLALGALLAARRRRPPPGAGTRQA